MPPTMTERQFEFQVDLVNLINVVASRAQRQLQNTLSRDDAALARSLAEEQRLTDAFTRKWQPYDAPIEVSIEVMSSQLANSCYANIYRGADGPLLLTTSNYPDEQQAREQAVKSAEGRGWKVLP